jgi:hypothetical protein
VEHAGLSISARAGVRIRELVRGIPHCLLLESEDGDLFLLVPIVLPAVGKGGGELGGAASVGRRSRESDGASMLADGFATGQEVAWQYDNAEWLESLGESRHHLYSIHSSGAYLVPQTLAASLYLYLVRLTGRRYTEAVQAARACACDELLPNTETATLKACAAVADDPAPDAHAARLHLSLAVLGTRNSRVPPWSLADELEGYVAKRRHVSAACRLSVAEELMLIEAAEAQLELDVSDDAEEKSIAPEVEAHRDLLQALFQKEGEGGKRGEEGVGRRAVGSVKPRRRAPATLSCFESVVDRACVDGGFMREINVIGKVAALGYLRPHREYGSKAVLYAERALGKGIRLRAGDLNLGFLFLYELLTGALGFGIFPGDSAMIWGEVLMRMLPDKVSMQSGALMSVLRAMSSNPATAAEAPKHDAGRRTTVFNFVSSATDLTKMLTAVQAFLKKREGDLVWPGQDSPSPYLPPAEVEIEESRMWVAVRGTDSSCAERTLSPAATTHDGAPLLSPADLHAFASTPLGAAATAAAAMGGGAAAGAGADQIQNLGVGERA